MDLDCTEMQLSPVFANALPRQKGAKCRQTVWRPAQETDPADRRG